MTAVQRLENKFMKRIAIAGFQHETNTYSPIATPFSEFEKADAWPGLLHGDEVISDLAGANASITGFADAAIAKGGYEIIPVIWCAAEPSSYVEDDAFERISKKIVEGIRNAGELDGVYLELHGAMVTQSYEDGEGEILRRVRDITGPDLPIAVSFDLHANITPEIIEHASSINIFRTYPHIDIADTGARAFVSMERLLTTEPLYKAFRQVPFLVPLTSQYTGAKPCQALYLSLDHLAAKTLFTADIAMGFPPADIFHAGPSIVAYADTQEDADHAADEVLQLIIDAEDDFDNTLLSPEAAVVEAMAHTGLLPIVIADAQDNAGAGASGDTTGMLSALVNEGAQGVVLALLNDVEIAAKAHELGVGAEFSAMLGGKSGQDGQYPFQGRFKVEALSDGKFPFTGDMFSGMTASLGPMAVLKILDTAADLRVVIGSVRCQCLDQAIFTHIGIDPTQARIIALKSTMHFRADFEPISDTILVIEAPGAHPCRLDKILYSNLRSGVRLGPGGQPHVAQKS